MKFYRKTSGPDNGTVRYFALADDGSQWRWDSASGQWIPLTGDPVGRWLITGEPSLDAVPLSATGATAPPTADVTGVPLNPGT